MQPEEKFFTESRKKIEEYVQNRISLLKLQMVEKASRLIAMLFSGLVIALLFFFILLFISIMGGYYFAQLTGSLFIGFGIISAFYIIVLLVVIKLRKNVIEKWVINIVIRTFFDKKDDDDDDEK